MENTLYRILVKQNPWWIKEKIDNPKAFPDFRISVSQK